MPSARSSSTPSNPCCSQHQDRALIFKTSWTTCPTPSQTTTQGHCTSTLARGTPASPSGRSRRICCIIVTCNCLWGGELERDEYASKGEDNEGEAELDEVVADSLLGVADLDGLSARKVHLLTEGL